MKRQRKKYKKPTRPWDKQRLEKERELLKNYGLKKKVEIWKAMALLRKYRKMAMVLAAKKDREKGKILIKKLAEMGLLSENANLDDVLGLSLENILDRRLQTVLFKKGLVNTISQARQLIVHHKVIIDDKKIFYPSYIVSKNEEDKIRISTPIKMIKEVAGEMKK